MFGVKECGQRGAHSALKRKNVEQKETFKKIERQKYITREKKTMIFILIINNQYINIKTMKKDRQSDKRKEKNKSINTK